MIRIFMEIRKKAFLFHFVIGLMLVASCSRPSAERKRFDSYFTQAFTGDTLHFYSAEYPNEVATYPFAGKELPFDLYSLFGPELATNWSDLGYGVYAVARVGALYVLRIPGRYTADQLALYRWENDGMLHYLATLSSKWCDEGWCNQQDGWLIDLNGNDRLDLVTHYAQIDDKNNPFQTELSVKLQDDIGFFNTAPQWPLDPSDFQLAR